ncbi:MAG: hypothetical protein K940chlam9_01120 [Chlamydiae bacterium]|nr:hypothetical protein [Chlamydiota bacterium]
MKKVYVFLFLLLLPMTLSANCYTRCNGWWGDIDFLLLWRNEHEVPSVIIEVVEEQEEDIVLFKGVNFERCPSAGARVDFGLWLCPGIGVGVGIFGLADWEASARGCIDPFELDGFFIEKFDIRYDVKSSLWGGDVYLRHSLIECFPFHLDVLWGFFYTEINDTVRLRSEISFDPEIQPIPFISNTFFLEDRFIVDNDFYAGMIGLHGGFHGKCWDLTLVGKVAAGNMCRKARDDTDTLLIERIQFVNKESADGSCIPCESRKLVKNKFAVAPMGEARFQYWICDWIAATAGYTLYYWNNIILADEEVILRICEDVPLLNPSFKFRDTYYWAQGLTVGFHFYY